MGGEEEVQYLSAYWTLVVVVVQGKIPLTIYV